MLNGKIHAIRYVKSSYTDGVDMTISGATSGIAIVTLTDCNATTTVMPRAATHGTDGSALLYATAGEPVEDKIPIANELIKIAVTNAGDSKSGTFHIWVE
jgi:hypothetical protein